MCVGGNFFFQQIRHCLVCFQGFLPLLLSQLMCTGQSVHKRPALVLQTSLKLSPCIYQPADSQALRIGTQLLPTRAASSPWVPHRNTLGCGKCFTEHMGELKGLPGSFSSLPQCLAFIYLFVCLFLVQHLKLSLHVFLSFLVILERLIKCLSRTPFANVLLSIFVLIFPYNGGPLPTPLSSPLLCHPAVSFSELRN